MKYNNNNKRKKEYKNYKDNNYKKNNLSVVNKRNVEPQKGFFGGNIANNMNFGGKDHELSGYVSRELVIIDKYGNKQIAKEKQFFNSSKSPMSVSINNNKSNF